jgi:hypothetical protein
MKYPISYWIVCGSRGESWFVQLSPIALSVGLCAITLPWVPTVLLLIGALSTSVLEMRVLFAFVLALCAKQVRRVLLLSLPTILSFGVWCLTQFALDPKYQPFLLAWQKDPVQRVAVQTAIIVAMALVSLAGAIWYRLDMALGSLASFAAVESYGDDTEK